MLSCFLAFSTDCLEMNFLWFPSLVTIIICLPVAKILLMLFSLHMVLYAFFINILLFYWYHFRREQKKMHMSIFFIFTWKLVKCFFSVKVSMQRVHISGYYEVTRKEIGSHLKKLNKKKIWLYWTTGKVVQKERRVWDIPRASQPECKFLLIHWALSGVLRMVSERGPQE